MKNTIFDRYHFLHKYFRMFANFINKIRYEPGLVIFLVSWFIINLIQSAFTGIFNDEAYYWMYSENLDWGYFDHPPMIALLIKIGYLIFPNQLGVRFITVVLSTLTLYFIYKLIDHEKKSVKWFIIITTSIILVHSHVCGFIAIPDSPLIFFTVIFFHLYKKFIQNESYTNTILLAIVIALMLYSKYHSVLVLFFTILSNWKIILKTRFWLIAIVSLALFSPHIYWQIVNDFPSLKYHLSERLDAYTIKHTINFIYSQILVAGPLIGVILIFFAFKYKPKNRLENALKFTLIGFYLFFFLSSFKGHTEAHWTAIAIIPLVILAFQEILDKPKILKWCQILFYPTIILFAITRIYYMIDFWPDKNYKLEVHHWDKWAEDIEKEAGDLPVVFMNSYQNASKYTFYTKKTAYSLNNIYYHQNQYDLWNIEDELQGKDVFIVFPMYGYPLDTLYTRNMKKYKAGVINNFRSFNKVSIDMYKDNITGNKSESISVPIQLKNNSTVFADFNTTQKNKPKLYYTYFQQNEIAVRPKPVINNLNNIAPGEFYNDTISIILPEDDGNYYIMLSIKSGWFPEGINGKFIRVTVN